MIHEQGSMPYTEIRERLQEAFFRWEEEIRPPLTWLRWFPWPAWLCRWEPVRRIYLIEWANLAYQRRYGVTHLDYGKSHRDIWGDEVGGELDRNDMVARKTGHFVGEESSPTALGDARTSLFCKYTFTDGKADFLGAFEVIRE